MKLFGDLPTLTAVDNPILPGILDKSVQPDIVINEDHFVTLVELTIPFNSPESLAIAKSRMENKEKRATNLFCETYM